MMIRKLSPRRILAALRRDRRGVSTVEFALIVPVIFAGYFGMSELSTAMMTARRVSHASSALANMTTQYSSLQYSNVTNILAASTLIMQPFSSTPLQLRLTSITLQSSGKATVDWSDVSGAGMTAYSQGTVVTPPAGLLTTTGDSIVMSEAKYAYTAPVPYLLPSGLNFSDTFYLRPRSNTTIPCTGC